MSFGNKRLILASAAVSAILVVALVAAVMYFPAHQVTQDNSVSTGNSIASSSNSSSTQSLSANSSTSSELVMVTSGLPAPCNCTMRIPWPATYQTLHDLKAASVTIVIANVTSASTIRGTNGVPVTGYNITVVKTLKGSSGIVPGYEIPVVQIGGAAAGTTMSVGGYPTLAKGGSYVFFLNNLAVYNGSAFTYYIPPNLMPLYVAIHDGGAAVTVGGPQGLFYVQGGRVFSLDNLYPKDDAGLPLKYSGLPLDQFVSLVESA